MKVLLKDIARSTGFTVNTVSRALRDKSDISDKTKKIIKRVAKEMNYIGDGIAGALRLGFTKTIAIILGDISNPYFAIIIRGIESEARNNGYNTIIINTEGKYNIEEQAIYSAINKKADGLILCPTQESDKDVRFLQENKIPFVLLGRRYKNINTDYVVSDDVKGGYIATKHLIDLGHKRILMLNAPKYISSAKERLQGYKKALKEEGIESNKDLIHSVSMESGKPQVLVKKVIESGLKFTAIFAFSDMMAWEAIYQLNILGYKIPQDFSVVGFDNIQSQLYFPMPLTTVNTYKSKTAKLLVEILLARIAGYDSLTHYNLIIDPELVIRKSTYDIRT